MLAVALRQSLILTLNARLFDSLCEGSEIEPVSHNELD